MLSSVQFISRDQIAELQETSSGSEEEQAIARKKRKHKAHKKSSKHSRGKCSFDSFSVEAVSDEIIRSTKRYDSRKQKKRHESQGLLKSEEIREKDLGPNSDLARELVGDAMHLARKEAGLDWMLNAPPRVAITHVADGSPPKAYEVSDMKSDAKELNPYWKSGEFGFPSEMENERPTKEKASFQPPGIGDGGASWRLKALKRAQEQAAREGRKLDEVVEERWGSIAALTSSVATKKLAHANAHLHARRVRKNQVEEREGLSVSDDRTGKGCIKTDEYGKEEMIRDSTRKNKQGGPQMKAPKINDSLSWRGKKSFGSHQMRPEDAAVLKAAVSTYNKYDNDGNFLKKLMNEQLVPSKPTEENGECVSADGESWSHNILQKGAAGTDLQRESSETPECGFSRPAGQFHDVSDISNQQDAKVVSQNVPECHSNTNFFPSGNLSVQSSSANQVAAKAMRLRLMGKPQEADELMKLYEDDINNKGSEENHSSRKKGYYPTIQKLKDSGSASCDGTLLRTVSAKHKLENQNFDLDKKLAESIGNNRQYKGPGPMSVDDEYDYDVALETSGARSRKKAGKTEDPGKNSRAIAQYKRIVTQHERCQFCFENPSRPKHLVVSIGNFTYLMLPTKFSLVQGHCYIVPMQHEGSTRNVDDNVWEEVRNFKKCLLKMFMQQNKDVLFIETVIGLARQKRHCLVECIPISSDKAKQAPLYFRKAIDEAEDEWSQHNAKKLIDTRGKGLRACIPKNFPYFHVEFGMQGGYCHVIDDEEKFNRNLGHDVIKGILQEPEEELHVHMKQQSAENQRQAVIEFSKMWNPYDWTKMLS